MHNNEVKIVCGHSQKVKSKMSFKHPAHYNSKWFKILQSGFFCAAATLLTFLLQFFASQYFFHSLFSSCVLRIIIVCPRPFCGFICRCCFNTVRLQLKCDVTRWGTREEVKGKLANGVGSQYSSHYLVTWCIQHYYRRCAHLSCQQSTELTPPPI